MGWKEKLKKFKGPFTDKDVLFSYAEVHSFLVGLGLDVVVNLSGFKWLKAVFLVFCLLLVSGLSRWVGGKGYLSKEVHYFVVAVLLSELVFYI